MNDEALIAELSESTPEEQPASSDALETVQESSEEPQPTEEENSDVDAPLSELLGDEKPKAKKERTDDVVPLASFLDVKNLLKEKEEELNALQSPDSAVAGLAEEYDVDVNFMQELFNAVKTETAKDFKEKYEPMLMKQQTERDEEKKNKLFGKVYTKALEKYPEIKDVANKEVIKSLALDPSNSNKSVADIIKMVYGATLTKVEEAPTPSFEKGGAGRTKSSGLDFNNLTAADHELIGSDPKLRKQYGEWVEKNITW